MKMFFCGLLLLVTTQARADTLPPVTNELNNCHYALRGNLIQKLDNSIQINSPTLALECILQDGRLDTQIQYYFDVNSYDIVCKLAGKNEQVPGSLANAVTTLNSDAVVQVATLAADGSVAINTSKSYISNAYCQ